mgnify:FL=1
MKTFYKTIGMPTSIPEPPGRKTTDYEICEMAEKCSLGKTSTTGRLKVLSYEDMITIYNMANR